MEEIKKKISIKHILKIILFIIVTIIVTAFFAKYLTDDDFRENFNTKIFNQDVSEEKINVIEIDSEDKLNIFSFDKYIVVVNKNDISFYDKYGAKQNTINMNIISPIASDSEKYLVLADEGSNMVYLFNESGIKWERKVDGSVYRVFTNKNGYVSVLTKSSTYKSIIIIYDIAGNELFKTYLANNYAVSAVISDNNEFLALGEINYSGTVVKSIIQYISINNAINKTNEAILNKYTSESEKIICNLSFNSKNEIVCMFNDEIIKVTSSSQEKLYEISENDIFVDTNLTNNYVLLQKENSGIFSYEYQIIIKSSVGKSDNLVMLENEVPKKVVVKKDTICVKVMDQILIYNTKGWLLKRYKVKGDLKDIIINENSVGAIYNNKIEIIEL